MRRVLLACAALLGGCTAIDSDTARPYPCEADADCRGGWVCGLEGVCHAPQPGAWKCDPDAGIGIVSCFGWHCGLEGVCYPLDGGVTHSCRYGDEQAGERADCDEGWRCGLEGSCHRVGETLAWRCLGDRDCEGTWRCAATGVCVDPSSERPSPSARPLSVERLAPVLFDSLPQLIAGSQASAGGLFGGGNVSTLTVAHGQQVSHVLYSSSGLSDLLGAWGPALADAGHGAELSWSMKATLPFVAADLTEVQDATGLDTWLLSGGAVYRLRWALDGTSVLSAVDAGIAFEGIVPALSGAVAWEGSRVYGLRPDLSVTPPFDLGDPVLATQVASATYSTGAPLIATVHTLWELRDAPDGGLEGDPNTLAYDDGGAFEFDGGVLWANGQQVELVSGGTGTTFGPNRFTKTYLAGPSCTLCPAGFQPVATYYCQSDAGVVSANGNGCTLTSVLQRGTPRAWARQGPLAWADAYGHLALGDSPIESPLGPRLDVPALHEVGGAVVVGASLGAAGQGGRAPSLFIARSGQGWRGVAGDGAALMNIEVRNAPSWVGLFSFDKVVDLAQGPAPEYWAGPTVGSIALQTQGADALTLGCLTSTADGGALLASTNGDLLASAAAGPMPPPAADRLAPFPSLSLTSLILFPGDPAAGTLVRGYALSSAGVAYLEAFTERAWSGVTVDIPPGDWLELLGDTHVARIAYSNGRIVTLPSRLDTSELLPVTAYDFATYAGTDFALTTSGLYRSAPNPDGGALSTWEAVPLPPGTSQPGFPPNDLSTGRLLGGVNGLYLVTPTDTTFAVRFDGGG